MQENQVLRSLLRGVSSFIGEGAGGILPKLGWDINDFENFVNRGETDTAWESYQRNKREKQTNQAAVPAPQPSLTSRKRSVDDVASGSRSKRPRGFTDENDRDNEYSILVPSSGPVPPNGFSRPTASSDQTMFNELMRSSNGSPMFVNSASPSAPQFQGQSSGSLPFAQPAQPPQYLHTIGLDSNVTSVPVTSGSAPMLPPPRFNQPSRSSPELDDAVDPKRDEATKLIQWESFNQT